MSDPRRVLANLPAATYTNLPVSVIRAPPASIAPGADSDRSGSFGCNDVHPRAATHQHDHNPAPATTITGDLSGFDKGEQLQKPVPPPAPPSPTPSEFFRDLFGNEDDETEGSQSTVAAALVVAREPSSLVPFEQAGNYSSDDDGDDSEVEALNTQDLVKATLPRDQPPHEDYLAALSTTPAISAPLLYGSSASNAPVLQISGSITPTIQPCYPFTGPSISSFIHPHIALPSSSPRRATPKTPPVLSSKAADKRRAVDISDSEAGSPTLNDQDENPECNRLLSAESRNFNTAIANSLQCSANGVLLIRIDADPAASTSGSSLHPPPVHARPYILSTALPASVHDNQGGRQPSTATLQAGPQGPNKRKRGDEDNYNGRMGHPIRACRYCANPFDELEKHQLNCIQNPKKPIVPHGHVAPRETYVSDPKSLQTASRQTKQGPPNDTLNDNPSTACIQGDPSLIGFSLEELQLWLVATGDYYGQPIDEERLYMCVPPLRVTTRELVSAFSEFQWPGPDAYHLYVGFKWFPVPHNLQCTNRDLGIRVGVFQNLGSFELRFIPLDIEGSPYATLDEFYSSLIQERRGGHTIHSLRVVDVTSTVRNRST